MIPTIIIGNWKEHPSSVREAKALFSQVKRKVARIPKVEFRVAVPFVFLYPLTDGTAKSKVKCGVQTVSAHAGGAHTGDVSALMAKSAGASFALVGHSESRASGDTDEIVNKKMLAALGAGLEVVLCIGERERDQDAVYLQFLTAQLESAFQGVLPRDLSKIAIAYEPVYAIGKSADFALTGSDVHEMVIFIRKFLTEKFNRSRAESMPVLYGAAVEKDNAHDLIVRGTVNGLLIGHASLDAEQFAQIGQLVRSI